MTKSKGLLIAVAIFLTGAAVGALGLEAWHVYRGGVFGKMERMGPAGFILEHMSRDLGLSPEQQIKIRPLIEEMIAKSDEARKPCFEAGEAVFEKYQAMIRALLTPEQAARHDEMIQRLRSMRMQGPPFGPPPGGPGLFSGPPPMFGVPPPPPPQ